MGQRTWTPHEAAAALPLVRRIVDDLVNGYRRWREAVEAFEYATSGTRADAPSGEADRLMIDAQRFAAEIDGLRNELARLDIRVTRVDHGLVAFRSERDGLVVPLLWAPAMPAPSYDWPAGVPAYGTSISWPSRAQLVAGKRSRA
jgi:hypothetical protein